MGPLPETRTQQGRRAMRAELLASNDVFVTEMPKIELHVHIEGTLTPELRWRLAQRNGLPVRVAPPGKHPRELQSAAEVARAYGDVISSAQLAEYEARRHYCGDGGQDALPEIPATFFEAYYSGCDVLRTRRDFFDLAFEYLQRAAGMNVRYCEVFFDPQSHTARGVSWEDLMDGLRGAQEKAAAELNVSKFVVAFPCSIPRTGRSIV